MVSCRFSQQNQSNEYWISGICLADGADAVQFADFGVVFHHVATWRRIHTVIEVTYLAWKMHENAISSYPMQMLQVTDRQSVQGEWQSSKKGTKDAEGRWRRCKARHVQFS